MKSQILALRKQILNGEKTINDIVDEACEKCTKFKDTNSIITDTYTKAKQQANDLQKNVQLTINDLLYGIPYVMKDNVCTKGICTTSGSAFLKDFVPPYNATIYEKLNHQNAIMICKSNMDEFGMGGDGIYSAFGAVKYFADLTRIVGGSSSGSVNLVSANVVPFAIGSDTGDSSRRPATLVGVVGYKPTYGLISRYGVMPYAPSLDHVGIIADSVVDTAIVAQHIVSFDEKDYTSQHIGDKNFYKNLKKIDKLTIGIVKDIEKYLMPNVLKTYLECITYLKQQGHIFKYVDFMDEYLKAIHTIYYIISYAEANSCWANLTGIHFGVNFGGKDYSEIITNARSSALGEQVKRRFTIGAYITKKENYEKYFIKAQKIRRLLVDQWNLCLNQVDVILTAGASSVTPTIADVLTNKFKTTAADDFLCIANFAGTPSISIPYCKIDNFPWGINLNCKQFADQSLFNIAYTIETQFEQKKEQHE
ncbi:MAG: aspartyl/glutamyl-tRNA amidotransferase subunit A [Mycoplasmataceae bacterium]|jgi:aspartyl-tRNA(Asn)/glutamyl-tRNA(Gln) amidotransferase subunit A|nr:aspartyl/glutamyl-tRNA amidotransferase subunit A [Mycoplasmataceae bacterium]